MKHFILVSNKKYDYELIPEMEEGEKVTRVICEAINLNQTFLNEDVPEFLVDLPNLILDEINFRKLQKTTYIRFRVTPEEKVEIQKKSLQKGFKNTSDFVRNMICA